MEPTDKKVSVGDVIKIEKAKVAKFRGELQLRLGRSGKLTVVQEENFLPLINVGR